MLNYFIPDICKEKKFLNYINYTIYNQVIFFIEINYKDLIIKLIKKI